MEETSMKGYLLLANGQLYEGTLMGAAKPVMAELVFTTAMTGYLETLTDPSYEGEIVIQTFPTIGNYGVIPEDFESPRPRLSAYIVRELCDEPSNFRCQGKLDDYLKAQGIPCLTGVDTRALTRVIRHAGGVRGAPPASGMRTPQSSDTTQATSWHTTNTPSSASRSPTDGKRKRGVAGPWGRTTASCAGFSGPSAAPRGVSGSAAAIRSVAFSRSALSELFSSIIRCASNGSRAQR